MVMWIYLVLVRVILLVDLGFFTQNFWGRRWNLEMSSAVMRM